MVVSEGAAQAGLDPTAGEIKKHATGKAEGVSCG